MSATSKQLQPIASIVTMREDLNGPVTGLPNPRKNKKPIAFIRYTVDIDRMEKEEPTSTDASVIQVKLRRLIKLFHFWFCPGF